MHEIGNICRNGFLDLQTNYVVRVVAHSLLHISSVEVAISYFMKPDVV